MIELEKLTPKVYYQQSRDFQFIGRLYDIVLNAVKTDSDLLYTLPFSQNSDKKLIDLMALTLGFKSRHNYNIRQLTALCNAFCVILKNKGSVNSLLIACNAILNAEGVRFNQNISDLDLYSIDYDSNARANKLILYISNELSDINLIKDLLDYTLPAGMSCEIVRTSSYKEYGTTELSSSDEVTLLSTHPDTALNKITNQILDWDNNAGVLDYAHNYAGLSPNSMINNNYETRDAENNKVSEVETLWPPRSSQSISGEINLEGEE